MWVDALLSGTNPSVQRTSDLRLWSSFKEVVKLAYAMCREKVSAEAHRYLRGAALRHHSRKTIHYLCDFDDT